MLETILQAIKKNGIKDYLIVTTNTEGAELYFIKKELDMRRMKTLSVYQVTVYRDFEKDGNKMRGFSSIQVLPEMDAAAVEQAVADAYYAASFAANPYFELPEGQKEKHMLMQGRLPGMSLEEIADAFTRAIYKADTRTDAFINTAEVFVTRQEISICNSRGIDVSYTKHKVNGEYVVQCLEPQDVELYQDFSFMDYDTAALTAQVEEALDTVCARAKAVSAPAKGEYNVILSGKQMYALFSLYMDRACTSYIYPGYSNYKVGMNVQGEEVDGEKLNITLKAVEPYSEEGIGMKDMELLAKGEVKGIYGNCRQSYYLGVAPTGLYRAMRVNNGTISLDEMKKEPYLHVVRFSDFQMDSFTGYFGGEIRLAYLFDGEKVTPVTGGSINGNLLELQKSLTFSTERYKDSRYDGPMAVRLCHVPVAGA
ncbi:MAG: metallopeptidase TldD-related protein [Roseburia sp.]